jgi:nitrogen fixation protein FixH
MARHVKWIVSALPTVVGNAYNADQLFDALERAQQAIAAGWEGKVYAMYDDGTVRLVNLATRQLGAPTAAPFVSLDT